MTDLKSPDAVIERFSELLNAGDVDGAVALYEPKAAFVAEPGQRVTGHGEIRPAAARSARRLSVSRRLSPSSTERSRPCARPAGWRLSSTAGHCEATDLKALSNWVVVAPMCSASNQTAAGGS